MKNRIYALICGALVAASGIGHGAYATTVNQAENLISPDYWGTWYEDNEEGRSFCKNYLEEIKTLSKNEHPFALDTSTVISSRMIHAVAGYGEGNFHQVLRVEKASDKSSIIYAKVSFDGQDETMGTSATVLEKMPDNRLWIATSYDGKSPTEATYFKCSGIPVIYADRVE